MPKTRHMSLSGQILYVIFFPNSFVAADIVDDLSIKHEKSPIDPAFSFLGFFMKFCNRIVSEHDPAEPRRRTHGGNGGNLSTIAMKLQQSCNVDICDTVTIGEHERVVIL